MKSFQVAVAVLLEMHCEPLFALSEDPCRRLNNLFTY
jgi:hypothetical protein